MPLPSFAGMRGKDHVSLSTEEEIELGKRIQQGDNEAKEKLVLANLKLVRICVLRYGCPGADKEDLFQEGVLALWRTSERYDWRQGCAFSTIAQYAVRKAITDGSWYSINTVRLPRNALETRWKIHKLQRSHDRTLTLEEIADAVGCTLEMAQNLRHYDSYVVPVSLDSMVHPDGSSWNEVEDRKAPRPGDDLESQDVRECLFAMLGALPASWAEVLMLRYGLNGSPPMTLQAVANLLQVALSTVCRREQRGLSQLRKLYPKGLSSLL